MPPLPQPTSRLSHLPFLFTLLFLVLGPQTVRSVQAQTLSSISLNPNYAFGGASANGTVTLSAAAPSGGKVVSLAVKSSAIKVPTSVTVAVGKTSATFTISTTPVSATAVAPISATLAGVTRSSNFTVKAAKIVSLYFNAQPTVAGGKSVPGVVMLSSPAPTGGTQVTLSSSNSVAKVPAGVTVAAGQTLGNFTINTSVVAARTNATINGTRDGLIKSRVLTITPATPSTLSINPTSVRDGASSKGTITLSSAAPTGGATVTLVSNNAAATVPASVKIAAGAKTATFSIATKKVSTQTTPTITATYGGASKTAALIIKTSTPVSLSLSPSRVALGGGTTGTVTLSSSAPSGGVAVTLSTSSSLAKVPTSVVVPSGASSAKFTVTTVSTSGVTSATIAAKASDGTRTATLSVSALAAPSILVEAGDGKAKISWTAVPNATSYKVKRATNSAGPFATVATVTNVPDSQLSYINTGLSNNTTYYYEVSTVLGSVEGPNSAPQSAYPRPVGLVTGVTATGYRGWVQLRFSTNSVYNTIRVYRAEKHGGPYTFIQEAFNGISFVDGLNLVAGKTYYYVMTTTIGISESAYSNEASATVNPIISPTLTATAGNAQATLKFNATIFSPLDNIHALKNKSYSLYQAASASGPFTLLWTMYMNGSTSNPEFLPEGTVLSTVNTGLTNGTTYYYKVQESAITDDATIYSPFSNVVSVKPQATAAQIATSAGQS